ncbi:hypothetical protein CE164_00630, partial [Bifidobacterium breve]
MVRSGTPGHCLPTVATVMPTLYTWQCLSVRFEQKRRIFCERSHCGSPATDMRFPVLDRRRESTEAGAHVRSANQQLGHFSVQLA